MIPLLHWALFISLVELQNLSLMMCCHISFNYGFRRFKKGYIVLMAYGLWWLKAVFSVLTVQVCDVSGASILHSLVRGSRVQVLERCGHAISLERPRKCARLLTDFISHTAAATIRPTAPLHTPPHFAPIAPPVMCWKWRLRRIFKLNKKFWSCHKDKSRTCNDSNSRPWFFSENCDSGSDESLWFMGVKGCLQ